MFHLMIFLVKSGNFLALSEYQLPRKGFTPNVLFWSLQENKIALMHGVEDMKCQAINLVRVCYFPISTVNPIQ